GTWRNWPPTCAARSPTSSCRPERGTSGPDERHHAPPLANARGPAWGAAMTTALREALEHTALGWIKPELDETLRLAKAELEDYAEDQADVARMRLCAGYLHQVQGTLRMVELYAPAMVAEEMEQVALALHAGTVADRDAACAALLRGIVLLPDYLERLQSGHRDIPIVLLPLLNELRATRGESGLSESVLFSPDLERPLPGAIAEGLAPASNDDAQPLLEAVQKALAGWQDD